MESINRQDFKPNMKNCPIMKYNDKNDDKKIKGQQHDMNNWDIAEDEPEQLGLDSCGCE